MMPAECLEDVREVGMAKKKTTPPTREAQRTLISLKGDPAWLDWLKGYADSLGIQATTAIDLALREQAKRDGFGKPMPKRLPK
jgi:hypothetical protein